MKGSDNVYRKQTLGSLNPGILESSSPTILEKNLILLILLFIPLFCIPAGAEEKNSYHSVTGPCGFRFPKDHGPHPGYRTEWWYYTGNLKGDSDRSFGFQLTFFRRQLDPPGFEKFWPRPPSAWRTGQIYLGHAAVSDISGKKHLYAQRMARNALNMAGVNRTDTGIELFIENWRMRITPQDHHLTASAEDFSFNLTATPLKPPILHGDSGYSRKGSARNRASCYYSITRLKTVGTLTINGTPTAVTGISWMDHEFSSTSLEPGIVGWDWFSLQLSDKTEVMIYLLRKKDGALSPASSGTYVDFRNDSKLLRINDLNIKVLNTWKSTLSDAVYPSGWQISIPPLSMALTVSPRFKDQEMRTSMTTGITYWEGSVSVTGTKNRKSIKGQGYVELTGYDKPMDSPM